MPSVFHLPSVAMPGASAGTSAWRRALPMSASPATVHPGDRGGEIPLGPELAPALDRVLPGPVVVGGARRDALARELLDALDDVPRLGAEPRHRQRIPLTSARSVALHRQLPASWSSIMFPAGSCRKICCDRGPTTPSETQ